MSKNNKEKKLKALLNSIQEGFPLDTYPFKVLSQRFGIPEDEIIDYLKDLKNKGIIRHFGATVNSYKLKYFTCLCATSIPEDKVNIAYEIAELPEVTHAYLREHNLNFWFITVTKNRETLLEFVKVVEKRYKLKIYLFPTKKKFKVKAVFKV